MSLLLEPARVAGRTSPAKLRHDLCVKEFGALLAVADLPPLPPVWAAAANLPSNYRPEWRRAVAEELLLRRAAGLRVPEDWFEAFADVAPFDDPLPLRALLERRWACALFPLALESEAGLGHVWVADDDFQGADRDGSAPFFVTSNGKNWNGSSWQLAAHLARRCLAEGNATLVAELARNWIITGRVEQERVLTVNLGNKLALNRAATWLIPLDNLKDVPPSAAGHQIRAADTLEAAWSHVSGRGLRQDPERFWPSAASSLDILIGGNLKAAMASALFMAPAAAVTLWTSPAFAPNAEAALIILSELRPDLALCPKPCIIPSDDLAGAERALRNELGARPVNTAVLFNITSGNRLMALAVDAVARLYPHVELIYRDIDNDPCIFSRLDYRQRPPQVGTYRGQEYAHPDLVWKFLWDTTRYASGTPQKIAAHFLANCRPEKFSACASEKPAPPAFGKGET